MMRRNGGGKAAELRRAAPGWVLGLSTTVVVVAMLWFRAFTQGVAIRDVVLQMREATAGHGSDVDHGR